MELDGGLESCHLVLARRFNADLVRKATPITLIGTDTRKLSQGRLTGPLSSPFSAKQLHDDGDDGQNQKYVDRESCSVIDNKSADPRANEHERQQEPNESHLPPLLRGTTYFKKLFLVIG